MCECNLKTTIKFGTTVLLPMTEVKLHKVTKMLRYNPQFFMSESIRAGIELRFLREIATKSVLLLTH